MIISSRTPEGDPNRCPICGKDTRTEPSETPVRDAPCPHCGHLLWFAPAAEEPAVLRPRRSWTKPGELLKAGRRRFGPTPGKLVAPVLEALGALISRGLVRNPADVEALLGPSRNWEDLTFRLRKMAGMPNRFSWGNVARNVRWNLRRLRPRRRLKRQV